MSPWVIVGGALALALVGGVAYMVIRGGTEPPKGSTAPTNTTSNIGSNGSGLAGGSGSTFWDSAGRTLGGLLEGTGSYGGGSGGGGGIQGGGSGGIGGSSGSGSQY